MPHGAFIRKMFQHRAACHFPVARICPTSDSSAVISLTEARRIISQHVVRCPARRVPLAAAHRLVLAEAVVANQLFPEGDRSQMDGYAVRADAVPGTFRLAGEISAGDLPNAPVKAGECYRIFTGALLPPDGGRVVMQEDTSRENDLVRMEKFGPKNFVRSKGSEARPGQVILPAGTMLGAVELAVLAQLGITEPLVIPRPAVHHLATGSELIDPADTPLSGKIRDTNTSLLRALFADAGATAFSSKRIPDDPDLLAGAAESAADLLILSGGASVGDHDHGAETLRRLGYTIHFDRVNLRPGKPLTFATRGSQAAFVVPGNPVSHFVCFHTAVKLAVEIAAGCPVTWPALWVDLSGGPTLTTDPRETWWPAKTSVRGGRLSVMPLPWSSSGNTFSLAGTNALMLVNSTSPADGKALTLLLEPPAA